MKTCAYMTATIPIYNKLQHKTVLILSIHSISIITIIIIVDTPVKVQRARQKKRSLSVTFSVSAFWSF